jgi:NAD(P)-dependent dehydrogenase (short-subunit alcohol dehydrogenase family)
MTEGLFGEDGAPDWLTTGIPLARTGNDGELDAAVVYLLSDASAYVTGHTLVVDGGLTAA